MDYFTNNKVAWILLILLVVTVSDDYGVGASHVTYEEFQSVSPTNITKHKHNLRTAYHFQPQEHWINDPNGPMYYNGVYHLFYQYNPNGSVWGNIVWAHSVSTDLINWIPLEPAIYPSKPFDQYGTWSGSATILPGNKPVIFYTGIIDANQTQVQNYAVPANLSDPYLRVWVKPDDNPLIVSDPSVNKTAFRDPTTAWRTPDGHWKILVGGRRSERGMAYLYRSRDLKKWVKAKHALHSKGETGNWECPDFYPVAKYGLEGLDTSVAGQNVKHVLKVSLDRTRFDIYTIGTYYNVGGGKERFVPDSGMVDGLKALRYDWGNCYASKTFFDPVEKRRVLWIWANESDPVQDDINKGWAGIQLIPRTVTLDPNGKQLLQWPVHELKTLRDQNTHMANQELKKGAVIEVPVKWPAQADVEVTFTFSSLDSAEPFDPKWRHLYPQDVCSRRRSSVEGGLGPFGLLTLASRHLEEYTPVFFRVFKDGNKHVVLMCSDGTSSTLAKGDYYKPSFAGYVDVDLSDKKLSLRSLIDHSVVESFGAKGKTVITSRVYPTLATGSDARLFVFNNGTETITVETLDAWNMKRPHMNQNH